MAHRKTKNHFLLSPILLYSIAISNIPQALTQRYFCSRPGHVFLLSFSVFPTGKNSLLLEEGRRGKEKFPLAGLEAEAGISPDSSHKSRVGRNWKAFVLVCSD